jgi:hypothetical protein
MYTYVKNDPLNAIYPLGLRDAPVEIDCNSDAEGSWVTCTDSSGNVVGSFPADTVTVVGTKSPESITGGVGLLPGGAPPSGSTGSGGSGGGGGKLTTTPVSTAAVGSGVWWWPSRAWFGSKEAQALRRMLEVIKVLKGGPMPRPLLPGPPVTVRPIAPPQGPPPDVPPELLKIMDKFNTIPTFFIFPPSWLNPDPCDGRFGPLPDSCRYN